MSFVSAQSIFEDSPQYLGDRPLYFQTALVQDVFRRFHADYVERRFPNGGSYFVAGTNAPVTELQFIPTESDGLLVRVPGRGDFCVGGGVCLAFVSRLDGRLKGVSEFRPGTAADGLAHAGDQLRFLATGDWIGLVATDTAGAALSELRRFLQRQRIDDLLRVSGAKNLVVVWRKGGVSPYHMLALDVDDDLRVLLRE